jgi:heme exporter protein A
MGLTVSELECVRGGRTVFRDLGFSLEDGQALIVRGPNGAGKTTLLRALAGLLPSRGTILLDGADDPDLRSDAVAYVGHLDAVKPQLTVTENLAFWADLLDGDADDALAHFELEPIADLPAQFCSAGQKRRVGLARLLLAPRRLWLLDEPTVSLDASAERLLVAAIERQLAAGGCVLIATHAPIGIAQHRVLDLGPSVGQASDPFLAGRWP